MRDMMIIYPDLNANYSRFSSWLRKGLMNKLKLSNVIIECNRLGKKMTSAVRQNGVSRYNGDPIKGPP